MKEARRVCGPTFFLEEGGGGLSQVAWSSSLLDSGVGRWRFVKASFVAVEACCTLDPGGVDGPSGKCRSTINDGASALSGVGTTLLSDVSNWASTSEMAS